MKLVVVSLALCFLSSSVSSSAAAPPVQSVKLSGPMVPLDSGDVSSYRIAPDGHTLVFRADHQVFGFADLYAVELDGSQAPLRLSAASDESVSVLDYALAPDGTRVVYVDSARGLWSAPLDASQPPLRLSPASNVGPFGLVEAGAVIFATNGSTVPGQVFRVPIDGSAAPQLLTPSGTTTGRHVAALFTSTAGSRVLFELVRGNGTQRQLYSVPADGSQAPIPATDADQFGEIERLLFSPDGSRAVFLAARPSFPVELFSLPADAHRPAVRLNRPGTSIGVFLSLPGDERNVKISPDGRFVLFPASASGKRVLQRAPIDGGRLPALLGPRDRDVERFELTHDGQAVVIQALDGAFGSALYLFPIANVDRRSLGARPGRRLGVLAPSLPTTIRGFALSDRRVVYLSNERTGTGELLSIALEVGATPQVLDGGISAGLRPSSFDLSADGELVVFEAGGFLRVDVFVTRADGSAPEVRVASNVPIGASPFSPDAARVLFLDFDHDGLASELFSVPADASAPPVRLHGEPAHRFDPPQAYRSTSNGDHVLYLARHVNRIALDLFAVPTDGSQPTKCLSALPAPIEGKVVQYEPTSDGSAAFFATDDLPGGSQLFRVPLDGSAPAAALGDQGTGRVVDFRVAPDGAHLVLGATIFNFVNPVRWLWTLATDGSGVLVPLTLDQPARVQADYQITADGAAVVFFRQATLWSVPIDGSRAPLALAGPLFDVTGFQLTADGQRVLFVDGSGLEMVPVDGSQPAVNLASQASGVSLGGLGLNAFFRAGADLFSVAVDGSAAPIALNGAVTGIHSYLLGPGRVFFNAGLPQSVYVSSIDGHAGPLALLPPFAPGSLGVTAYLTSSATSRVIFLGDSEQLGVIELYSVPFNGSQPPVRLNAAGVHPLALQLSSDGTAVVYRTELGAELRAAAVLGGSDVRLNGTSGVVQSFLVAPGRRAVYTADQDSPHIVELYSSPF